ncbi:hypothetical protein T09_7566 [Trichinella sp. T9]|nr:hypothetical protein T09_7566 [Trichinella sp. T9]
MGSLNLCLDPGPKLQPDLVAILLCFCRHRKDVSANWPSPRRSGCVPIFVARSRYWFWSLMLLFLAMKVIMPGSRLGQSTD